MRYVAGCAVIVGLGWLMNAGRFFIAGNSELGVLSTVIGALSIALGCGYWQWRR